MAPTRSLRRVPRAGIASILTVTLLVTSLVLLDAAPVAGAAEVTSSSPARVYAGGVGSLTSPTAGVVVGGNLYVADTAKNRIRRFVLATGAVSTLAGSPSPGTANGAAGAAKFNAPQALASDGTNLYVADTGNHTIRKVVLATGVVSTLAGVPGAVGSAEGPGATATFNKPSGVLVVGTDLWVADTGNHRLRKVVLSTGVVSHLVGTQNGIPGWYDSDGAMDFGAAAFNKPMGMSSDGTYVYVADSGNNMVRRIQISDPSKVVTLAGYSFTCPTLDPAGCDPVGPGANDGSGLAAGRLRTAKFDHPTGVVRQGSSLYVADEGNHLIRKVLLSTGDTTTLAGTAGSPGTADGVGPVARFRSAAGIASDGTTLYVADTGNSRIRTIVPSSSTVATMTASVPNGGFADSSDELAARFLDPRGVAVVPAVSGDKVYVADTANEDLRHIDLTFGEVRRIAGTPGMSGVADGSPLTGARFETPTGVASDGTVLYVTDPGAHTIRRVPLAGGAGTTATIAGSPNNPGSADGAGTSARFREPQGLALAGNQLYVADAGNHTIRVLNLSSGTVSTLAGSPGNAGWVEGAGTAARFNRPSGVAVVGAYLYVADTGNNSIRRVEIATGAVTNVAGTGGTTGTVDGASVSARFDAPVGIAGDGTHLFVADTGSARIRKIVVATKAVSTLTGVPGAASSLVTSTSAPASGVEVDVTGGLSIDPGGNGIWATVANAVVLVGDVPPPTVEPEDPPVVSVADASVLEGTGGTTNLVFTVSLDRPATIPGTVTFKTGATGGFGSATPGTDFTMVDLPVVFEVGDQTKTVGVPVVADSELEGNETFLAILSSPDDLDIGDSQAVGTIVDDETLPSFSFEPDITVPEGNVDAPLPVKIKISGPTPEQILVDYAVQSGGSATVGSSGDVSGPLFGTALFVPGEPLEKVLAYTLRGDTVGEPTESFQIKLSNPRPSNTTSHNTYAISGSGTIRITLVNDDPPVARVNSPSIVEGNSGTQNLVFTVSLNTPALVPSSVVFATADGLSASGATAPGDYTPVSQTLTFTVGETTKTVSVPIVGDTLHEPDEFLPGNLSNPVGVTISGQGFATITNDDAAPSMSIGDVTVLEGDTNTLATLTVTLSAPTYRDFLPIYSTHDGTAVQPDDYTKYTNLTTKVLAGTTSATITVPIKGDDLVEGTEAFTVTLATAPGDDVTIADGSATVTIVDDETTAPPVASVAPATRAEGNSGTSNLVFTVSLDKPAVVDSSVGFATSNGTATAPGDYTAVTQTVTFAPGQQSKTVNVPVVGDTVDELDETFTATLSAPVALTLGTATATGTIVDDDEPVGAPAASIADVSITEDDLGNPVTPYAVTLSAPAPGPVSVRVTSTNGTAVAPGDFFAVNTVVSFAAGETSKAISLGIIGDRVPELEETFTLQLSEPVGLTLGRSTATITIVDNDPVVASVANRTANEGQSGTTEMVFTVSLSAPALRPSTVRFRTTNGSAVAPADYTAVDTTVAFAVGETSKTVSVTILGDGVPENDEFFNVVLSEPSGITVSSSQPFGTITNDDFPTVSIAPVTVTEGSSGTSTKTYAVSLDRGIPATTSVRLTSSNGTAVAPGDFTAINQVVTFSPGATLRLVDVVVVGDTAVEGDETFTMTLSSPTKLVLGTATASVTIQDDDAPPGGPGYVAMTPVRVCDTRTTVAANPCNAVGQRKLGPNTTRELQITGANGIPAGISAVVVNVAATNTTSSSYLTVWPQGQARPNAASLNWAATRTVSNLVEVPVSAAGRIAVWNSAGDADLVVDVQGYVTEQPSGVGVFNALSPARICDTRLGGATAPNPCNANGTVSGHYGPGVTKTVQVTGQGGVPASGVAAVVLNVAVTGTTAAGFLKVWPSGQPFTDTANLNWSAGQTTSNRVIVPVGPDGKVSIRSSAGTAHVVVDVNGWFSDSSNPLQAGAHYTALTPTRVCDTRAVGTGIAANQCNGAGGVTNPFAAKAVRNVSLASGGVPADATAVVLNVAVTGTTGNSFLTAYPHGEPRPDTADLNWEPGQTVSNLVVVKLGADGTIDLWHYLGRTDVVIDVQGYYR